jgi:hypothetical protein
LPHLAVLKVTLRPRRSIASEGAHARCSGKHRGVPICGGSLRWSQKTTISERQAGAPYRVVSSMNPVGARICVAADDLLSPVEMVDLERRLYEPICPLQVDAFELEVASQQ